MRLVHSDALPDALPGDELPRVDFALTGKLTAKEGVFPLEMAATFADQMLTNLRKATDAEVVYWNISEPDADGLQFIRIWAEPDLSRVRAVAELAGAMGDAFPKLWRW